MRIKKSQLRKIVQEYGSRMGAHQPGYGVGNLTLDDVREVLPQLSSGEQVDVWEKYSHLNNAEELIQALNEGKRSIKITKRQLRRIIREEKRRLLEDPMRSPEHGLNVPVPTDDDPYLVAEEALQALIGALASMDPGAAGDMARYAMDELHGFKR